MKRCQGASDEGFDEDGADSVDQDEEDDDSEDDDYDDDDDDEISTDESSSLGSEIDVEAERLWDAMHTGIGGPPPQPYNMIPSPEQVLQDHLTALNGGSSSVLKLDDAIVQHILEMSHDGSEAAEARKQEAILQLYMNVLHAIRNSNSNHDDGNRRQGSMIKHVILGTKVLQCWTPDQQRTIYEALTVYHSTSITYWKLGTNDNNELCGIPTDHLMSILTSKTTITTWPMLTEFQIRGIELTNVESIHQLVRFLKSISGTIKLFNLLGMIISPDIVANSASPGCLFDPLLHVVETSTQLDEVQLHRIVDHRSMTEVTSTSMCPLVSAEALLHMLQIKPKWWRLALDGMGLQDTHLQVIGRQLVASKECKMNDLLSIRNNPELSPRALSQLYHLCINKQRMGLVLSDDKDLNALVDLVRPLNNLHRRLEYKDEQGNFSNVDTWLGWLQALSNLPWLDEARKLNYIWFTLLEQPAMISTAIHACSSTTAA